MARPVPPMPTISAGKSTPEPVRSGGAIAEVVMRPVSNTAGLWIVAPGVNPDKPACFGVTSRRGVTSDGNGVLFTADGVCDGLGESWGGAAVGAETASGDMPVGLSESIGNDIAGSWVGTWLGFEGKFGFGPAG